MPVVARYFAAVREESLARRGSTPMILAACSARGELEAICLLGWTDCGHHQGWECRKS
jgi:hypothetical protein